MEPQKSVNPSRPPARVHIETWGCQMNVADSERMLALMKLQDFQLAESEQEADLIILNTCHIREKAKHKVMSRLGILRQLKDKNPGLMIAVAGCVAQAEGRKLMEEAPVIDILLGPGKIQELPSLVADFRRNRGKQIATGFMKTAEAKAIDFVIPLPLEGKNEVSRYVNIQQGCNNFCTFCVVPFTRGREISSPADTIKEQVNAYVASGAREITLLGQNVNSYGLDLVETGALAPSEGPFVDLLREVAEIPELRRLRFTSSNPHDFTKPLADLFKEIPKLGKYIHLPVQSGSDRILTVMKRKVTVAEYWERLAWLKNAVPDMAVSTDLIVGFPGETDDDFQKTYELVEKAQFTFIYSFKYSPRKGTAAARFRDQVDETNMVKRLAALNALQDRITIKQNEAEIGQTRRVLFHYASQKDPQVYYGKTEHFRPVRIKSGRDMIGKEVDVHILDANKTALEGTLVCEAV
ncbi:MAG: tRNA (N6-isopentenyl adenosine(37)-C2)-methylthiotransferase MiaB [Deltaproteobacteria bacterium]|nr:tRNA (N6-isopentenyl adenosine(37)-C2)-methylthiotransferase MiaB [Deltaproteobacteria bacterium]